MLENLRPVTLADRELFQRYLKEFPPVISELTFSNLYCWGDIRHHLFCEFEGHLLVTYRDEHCVLNFYPPIGPNPKGMMSRLFEGLKRYCWARIDEHLAHSVMAEGKKMLFDRKNSDYVYNLAELRELAGKKFDGKRNFVKRFAKHDPVVRPLTGADLAACMLIQESWLEFQGHNPSAREESTAMIKALQNFDAFGLHGVGLVVSDKLVGFAVGEPLNNTTFVEHFEKGLPEYSGVYPFLLNAFAKSIPAQYTHLNREQDLGIDGIRKSKESWNPEYLIRKFTLRA